MSVGLSLYIDGHEVREINWFGPYGLAPWASMNYRYFSGRKPKRKQSLHYITHEWAAPNDDKIDRALFQDVVLTHAQVVMNLAGSYFFFGAAGFQNTLMSEYARFPKDTAWGRITGQVWKGAYIGIPVEYFTWLEVGYKKTPTTQHYQEWFERLIEFADLLQNPAYSFYCSV